MIINYPILAHFRHFSSLLTDFPSTTVENVRQITPFYAKQSQFCAFLARKRRFHEKTKPIQTQLKPKQTQFKPNKANNKPNSNPTCRCVAPSEDRFVERPKRLPIANGAPAPQFIEKLTKMLQIFKQFVNIPPFLIDNSINYALYGSLNTLFQRWYFGDANILCLLSRNASS